jgi:hypothetical protein
VKIEQLVTAESGWRAVFKEPDGSESLSRVLGWAVLDGEEPEIVGVIVDPAEPSRIIAASEAVSPDGGDFARYRYVAPEPPPPPPPAPATAEPEPEEAAQQLAKGLLKRRR